jgi:hypothetical protein
MSAPDPAYLILSFEHPTHAVDSVAEAMAHGLRCQGVNATVCTLPRDLPRLAQWPADQVCGILDGLAATVGARGRPADLGTLSGAGERLPARRADL